MWLTNHPLHAQVAALVIGVGNGGARILSMRTCMVMYWLVQIASTKREQAHHWCSSLLPPNSHIGHIIHRIQRGTLHNRRRARAEEPPRECVWVDDKAWLRLQARCTRVGQRRYIVKGTSFTSMAPTLFVSTAPVA